MNLYKETEKFVTESFEEINDAVSLKHLVRTVYWLKELYPEADEAMQVAALAHDIQRAFKNNPPEPIRTSTNYFLDEEFLKFHQERGGEIMTDFLMKHGADRDFADRVRMLIGKHEVGGTDEQNILKDADSVSFFENNVDFFVDFFAVEKGKEVVREKFNQMYNRITSEKAKEIARPWYEEGIKRLS